MNFDYEPLTEEEVQRERYSLLPDGQYKALVKKATARMSRTNNMMAEVLLDVYDAKGKIHPVFDFLVFTKNMMWKVKHFCDSAGLSKEYLSKELTPEMVVDLMVTVNIITKQGSVIPEDKLNGKTVGSKYPDKNAVDDYVCESNDKKESLPFNDDINF